MVQKLLTHTLTYYRLKGDQVRLHCSVLIFYTIFGRQSRRAATAAKHVSFAGSYRNHRRRKRTDRKQEKDRDIGTDT